MKRHISTALLYTLVTALVLGIGYPLLITGLAQWLFPRQANGSMIELNHHVVGSLLIGQTFTSPAYFHSRPSSAGSGYDATSSGGSNLGPTSQSLIDRIHSSVAAEQDAAGAPVPIDLVTASGSGLDPDISPAAALYQAPRIAASRRVSLLAVQQLISSHTTNRQFGLLGEQRVNVLALNLALDLLAPLQKR